MQCPRPLPHVPATIPDQTSAKEHPQIYTIFYYNTNFCSIFLFFSSQKLVFATRVTTLTPPRTSPQKTAKPTFDTRKTPNAIHTHFSRNPKIAAFLKAYHFVKEFGEGFDRIYRELEANGTSTLSFRTDDFILKITVPKVIEKVSVNEEGVVEKVDVNVEKVIEKVTVNRQRLIEKLIERATINGDKLTKNRITILELMSDNPYITIVELAKEVGISDTSIMRNIDYMRGKYLRRVGADKNGFWEIIE